MGNLLKRAQILNVNDARQERIHVEEWDGDVIIKSMTGIERDNWEVAISDQKKEAKDKDGVKQNIRANLVALVLIDNQGKLLFTPEDVEALGRKSAKALDRIYSVAAAMSGITDADLEELVKNSSETVSDDSPSDSPVTSDAHAA